MGHRLLVVHTGLDIHNQSLWASKTRAARCDSCARSVPTSQEAPPRGATRAYAGSPRDVLMASRLGVHARCTSASKQAQDPTCVRIAAVQSAYLTYF
ncbi:hypothetical protein BC834DRAFT_634640 [Gloeopeniophorella convolvens]|nr:hypothetical protein BC834DRAFT_634640 [Gloeopeniophorella convolvens]